MVSIVVSSLELRWSGDGGAVLDTGRFSFPKGQGVTGGDGPVMEHDSCKQKKKRSSVHLWDLSFLVLINNVHS